MKKYILRKGLVCAVIALFIGVAIAPSITAVDLKGISFSKEAIFVKQDEDLVEIKVQLFKLVGKGEYSVMLPRQKAMEVDALINDIESSLADAETGTEAVTIIKDAVVSLNDYGLLPSHMSISEVQELVTTNYYDSSAQDLEIIADDIEINLENAETQDNMEILNEALVLLDEYGLLSESLSREGEQQLSSSTYQNQDILELVENLFYKNQENGEIDTYNLLCLVATHVEGITLDVSISIVLVMALLTFLSIFIDPWGYVETPFVDLLLMLTFVVFFLLTVINQIKPFKLLNWIDIDEGAAGTIVHTLGLLGLKSDIVGSKGAALVGFTGIRIIKEWKLLENDESFYLGSTIFTTESIFPV